jgi:nucleoside-diphosphate-sugar epimerase
MCLENLAFECRESLAMIHSARFMGRKVLVSGASGFIGSHLCRRLLQDGAEVHGVSRILHCRDEHGISWWQGDLAEAETARSIVMQLKPDFVFHLASHVAGARQRELVGPTFASNLVSTVNLLDAASEAGCRRVLLAGSLEEPEPGDSQAVPCSPYAAAKWAGSVYARMFHALYQLPVVICRLFMVYGPGQQDLRKLVPYVILSLLRGEAPQLMNGRREIDWIYVDDVVEGFIAAAAVEGIEGKTVDLGSGSLIPVRTVVEKLVCLINPCIEPRFGAVTDRPFEQVRVAAVENSLDLIEWKPTVSLEEGLKRTANWYALQSKGSGLNPSRSVAQ